ncbi:MAG: hypothetical protein U0166_03555 [Acidobacteriota bacterium]
MRRFVLLGCAVFLFDAWFLHEDESSNARVRLALAKAIVLEGRLTIDSYESETNDKALFEGHYYCDKAPLTSLLAIPPLAALEALGIRSEPVRAYVTRVVTVSLATAMALPVLGLVLRRLGISERAALVTVAMGWSGTALLPYGTVFFGHNLTFALIVGALAATPDRPWLTGTLLGLAITSDYQAAPLAAFLALPTILHRDRAAIARLALGLAPPLLLLGLYHFALFGNPLTVPVKFETHGKNMDAEYDTGFYGMSLPGPKALGVLLLSPGKGLVSLSPFLLILPYAFSRRPVDPMTRIAAVAFPLFVAFIAMVPSYHGGFAFGPRLLIPGFPLLFLLLGRAVDAAPRPVAIAAAGAAAISAAAYVAATVTLIAVPYSYTHPLTEIAIPWLLAGKVAPNAGNLLGLRGTASLAPILAIAGGLAWLAFAGMDRRVESIAPTGTNRRDATSSAAGS